jgi:hypothetical protein
MVDFQQDGELLGRIRSIRKKFAQDMGFLPPVVHIRDNMDLPPARYRILMKGLKLAAVMPIRAAGWRLTRHRRRHAAGRANHRSGLWSGRYLD